MNTRQKHVVNRLKELDNKGVKFHDAKQTLLEEGYTEQEIVQGLYDFSYDGKPNKPNEYVEQMKHYQRDAEAAKFIADGMLKDQKDRERMVVLAEAAASKFAPGMHGARYEQRFAEKIGIPWWRLAIVSLFVFAIVVYFGLPWLVFEIYALSLSAYGIVKLVTYLKR